MTMAGSAIPDPDRRRRTAVGHPESLKEVYNKIRPIIPVRLEGVS